jgi:aspartyl-tRNA(Asn)/glutamyl-tRNA(Gln) amidotransferase subunit C
METDKLNKDKVIHVANLARLELTNEEIEKYQYQLKNILKEIEKIQQADLQNDEIMISPSKNKNCYKRDEVGEMLCIEDVLKNANNPNGDYIEVLGVIND